MDDLERVMRRVSEEQSRKKLTRRFIVTEGLFERVGDCVDLPRLVSARGPGRVGRARYSGAVGASRDPRGGLATTSSSAWRRSFFPPSSYSTMGVF